MSNEVLDRKIAEHDRKAKLAMKRTTFGVSEITYGEDNDQQLLLHSRDKVARLEGLKTKKSEVGLVPKPDATVIRKSRSDVFSQSYLRPQRGIDEVTGRTAVKLLRSSSMTRICG